jgi:hypothetical protein
MGDVQPLFAVIAFSLLGLLLLFWTVGPDTAWKRRLKRRGVMAGAFIGVQPRLRARLFWGGLSALCIVGAMLIYPEDRQTARAAGLGAVLAALWALRPSWGTKNG